MPIIDLSHKITAELPLYPGTPDIEVRGIKTVENDGYAEGKLSFTSHIGTHLDAPAHMIKEGATLDSFSIERFVGTALVISTDNAPLIESEAIIQAIDLYGKPDWIIIRTGWSQKWGTAGYFCDFPILSPSATEQLIKLKISGIAIDASSFDPVNGSSFYNHLHLLGAEILLGENFTNLGNLPTNQLISLSVLPLFWDNADGAPARAVAQW